jgi:hypothetical protein
MPALEERTQPVLDGRLFGGDDERTLDDVVLGVLYDVSRGDPAPCPVCGAPSLSGGGEDVLECGSCGSRLEAQ